MGRRGTGVLLVEDDVLVGHGRGCAHGENRAGDRAGAAEDLAHAGPYLLIDVNGWNAGAGPARVFPYPDFIRGRVGSAARLLSERQRREEAPDLLGAVDADAGRAAERRPRVPAAVDAQVRDADAAATRGPVQARHIGSMRRARGRGTAALALAPSRP